MDHGASFEVGVFGEGAKLKPAGTPYLQALKNSLGKTLSQSKLLLIETEVVSFTVKNPEQFFQQHVTKDVASVVSSKRTD